MTDVATRRLRLHPIDISEGGRIVARQPGPDDRWAEGYPSEGEAGAVAAYLRAAAVGREGDAFGYYQIVREADGSVVGGIGFKGRPEGGSVEIGYGLAASARGQGFAAEAVAAILGIATENGVARVLAETTPDNVASQRTLLRAGFQLVATDEELYHYEVLLDE